MTFGSKEQCSETKFKGKIGVDYYQKCFVESINETEYIICNHCKYLLVFNNST